MSDPFLAEFPQDVQEDLSVMVTVVQLFGGAFLWLAVSKAPADLDCIRRRLSGILVLYLPCKYLSVASVFCEMIYVCAFPFAFAQALGKAALILRLISLVFAFALFLLRVNTLWRSSMIWSLTALSMIALMTAIGLELFRIDQAYIGDSHVALVAVTLYLSTVVFTFATLGVLGPGRGRDSGARPSTDVQSKRNILHRLSAEVVKGGTVSMAFHWLSCVTISPMFLALRNWTPLARRSLCYVAWLVIIHAACRQYERLAEQKSIFLAPSLSFRWLSRGLSTARPNSSSEQMSETRQEPEACPNTHKQSLDPARRLEVDLVEVEKIDLDVLSRDLIARRPFAQAIRANSEASTSASSSQLPSPVFSAISSTTGCTSTIATTATPSSASQETFK